MTETNFDERLGQIETEYAQRRENADAYRDQELARLFVECEWSQERIGRHLDRAQSWVSQQLTFGRFLEFITARDKSRMEAVSLTEWAFRELYKKTKGKEKERFAEVAAKLAGGLVIRPRLKNLFKKPGFRQLASELLADGKWHNSKDLKAAFLERFPDADQVSIDRAISGLVTKPLKGFVGESKNLGEQKFQYRLRPRDTDSSVAPAVIDFCEKVEPIIKELAAWGKAHEFAMAPKEIGVIAVKLRRLVDSLTAKQKA